MDNILRNNVFLYKASDTKFVAFTICRQLGYNCEYQDRLEFDLADGETIFNAQRQPVDTIVQKLGQHCHSCHPNFDKGMHDIGDKIKQDGFGVIKNFCDPEVCWALNTYLAASGLETETIRKGNKIAGGTYQSQTMLDNVKKFFTKTEPYIDSPYWDKLEPFFKSLESLGRMLMWRNYGWKGNVVFDGKLSFLTSRKGKGYQFPHFDQPYANVIQIILVVSDKADPTLAIPNGKLNRGEPVYSFDTSLGDEMTDERIRNRVRCLADMPLAELEALMKPMSNGKLNRGDLIVFCSDVIHAGPKNDGVHDRRVLHMTLRPEGYSNPLGDVQWHIGMVAQILYNADTDGDYVEFMVKHIRPFSRWSMEQYIDDDRIKLAMNPQPRTRRTNKTRSKR